MHRVGFALIVVGLLLLASPLYLTPQAVITVVDPNLVWIGPRGTSQSAPYTYTSFPADFSGLIGRSGSGWELSTSCSYLAASVSIYRDGTHVTSLTWNRGEIVAVPSFPNEAECEFKEKTLGKPPLDYDIVYKSYWTLYVYDSSGNLLGHVDNPDIIYFVIKSLPTVSWTINGKQVTQTSKLLVTKPINFKMTVTSGDASIITGVKIDVYRGSSNIATLTLSKTSSNTWETSWNPSQLGEYRIVGYYYINNELTKPITTLSTIIDLGGDRFNIPLSPLQLLGLVCMLAGFVMVVLRRD